MVGAPGEGLKIALRTLDHTRVTIGAQAVGIAQGALDAAVAYVKERKQFGKAIAEFQGVQFMLADMAMKLEAARQMVYVAAAKSERGDSDLTNAELAQMARDAGASDEAAQCVADGARVEQAAVDAEAGRQALAAAGASGTPAVVHNGTVIDALGNDNWVAELG